VMWRWFPLGVVGRSSRVWWCAHHQASPGWRLRICETSMRGNVAKGRASASTSAHGAGGWARIAAGQPCASAEEKRKGFRWVLSRFVQPPARPLPVSHRLYKWGTLGFLVLRFTLAPFLLSSVVAAGKSLEHPPQRPERFHSVSGGLPTDVEHALMRLRAVSDRLRRARRLLLSQLLSQLLRRQHRTLAAGLPTKVTG